MYASAILNKSMNRVGEGHTGKIKRAIKHLRAFQGLQSFKIVIWYKLATLVKVHTVIIVYFIFELVSH